MSRRTLRSPPFGGRTRPAHPGDSCPPRTGQYEDDGRRADASRPLPRRACGPENETTDITPVSRHVSQTLSIQASAYRLRAVIPYENADSRKSPPPPGGEWLPPRRSADHRGCTSESERTDHAEAGPSVRCPTPEPPRLRMRIRRSQ